MQVMERAAVAARWRDMHAIERKNVKKYYWNFPK